MAIHNNNHSVPPPVLKAYLSTHFGEDDQVFLQTSGSAKAGLEIHRKHSRLPVFGQISAPPAADGFLIALALAPYQLRPAGQPVVHFLPDSILIHDLNHPFDAYIGSSFDIMFLYIAGTALSSVAAESGAAPITHLSCAPGLGDPVLAGLARAFLPALYAPARDNTLFIDQLAFALNLHVAQRYGGLILPGLTSRRGLSPRQEKRAKDYLAAQAGGDVSIAEIAAACGMSRSYFIRSFRETTGKTPYRWLIEHRVSRARTLLAQSRDTIAEIAINCGFADQSHLTRMFTREVGMSPSIWRRDYRA